MTVDVRRLKIISYPDPVLRAAARQIDAVDRQIQAVAARMIELMHEAAGVGLAAPQVGLGWRMFVANPTGQTGEDRVFINPRLSNPGRITEALEEGCLSLPEIRGQITRPIAITIDALDQHAKPFQLTSNELSARVWQHEYDHLNGVLIIDKMPRIDRIANKRAIAELEKLKIKN